MKNTAYRLPPTAYRAFTLVETMVAVTILTFAVVGPMMVASRAIVAAQIARSQLTANYLAQEGIEYVRAMRDNEYLTVRQSQTAWNNFLNGSSGASISQCRTSTCTFDPARTMGTGSGLSLTQCSGSGCTPLYLANGVYTQQSTISGSVVTPFNRTIQIIDIPGTTDSPVPHPDKRIISKVEWRFHGTLYSVTVTNHLTPWQ